MQSVRFQLRDLIWGLVCVALVLGWLADHVRQQSLLERQEEAYLTVRGRLDGLIYQYEFETDRTIEEDEHTLWIVDDEEGSRLPVTGRYQQIDGSSALGERLLEAIDEAKAYRQKSGE